MATGTPSSNATTDGRTRRNLYAKGVWEHVFEALQEPDLEWMMIDSTTVRAHQCAAGKKTNATAEALGRSRGGFTTKVHAAVDALGNPLRFILTPGQRADITQAEPLVMGFKPGAVIGDKGFDSDRFIACIKALEAEAVIPSKKNRIIKREINTNLYADRNKIERFSIASNTTGALPPATRKPLVTTWPSCTWPPS